MVAWKLMVEAHTGDAKRRARIYGLALCFLMLVFFSAVKLARYHSSERDFAANKVWQQQDTGDKQALQIEHQQQTAICFLAVMALMSAPVLAAQWIPVRVLAPFAAREQWLDPSLFLRPPPAVR